MIALGAGDDGHAVGWDRDAAPHLLVTGPTGSGKTVAIRGVVVTWALAVGRVVLCDPKRVEYLAMRGRQSVEVVTDPDGIAAAVLAARDEMNARYAAVEAGGDAAAFTPLLLVVVDEAAAFIEDARQGHRGRRRQGA